MTNKHQNQNVQLSDDEQFISYCGIYCKECTVFLSGKCEGCRVNSTGYKECEVKPCCVEKGFFTCTDCTKYASAKDCIKYNHSLIKVDACIQSTSRIKAIEIIQAKGRADLLAYMIDINWVIISKPSILPITGNLVKKIKQ